MESDLVRPVNIGSSEMVSIDRLAEVVKEITGKRLSFKHIPGPEGVRGRTSDNRLIEEELRWAPSRPFREGLERTYTWMEEKVEASQRGSGGNGDRR